MSLEYYLSQASGPVTPNQNTGGPVAPPTSPPPTERPRFDLRPSIECSRYLCGTFGPNPAPGPQERFPQDLYRVLDCCGVAYRMFNDWLLLRALYGRERRRADTQQKMTALSSMVPPAGGGGGAPPSAPPTTPPEKPFKPLDEFEYWMFNDCLRPILDRIRKTYPKIPPEWETPENIPDPTVPDFTPGEGIINALENPWKSTCCAYLLQAVNCFKSKCESCGFDVTNCKFVGCGECPDCDFPPPQEPVYL